MNVAIRNGMLVRGRYVKPYKGEDMPHYIFSARKRDHVFPVHSIEPARHSRACAEQGAVSRSNIRNLDHEK
jgi:hypothetical protein